MSSHHPKKRGRAALARRYGRGRGKGRMRGHSDAGMRQVEMLLRAQDAPTRHAPKMSMREQIAWDRRLKAIREAEEERDRG
jgi:hypothetical protein